MGLDGPVLDHLRPELVLEHEVGFPKALLDIALAVLVDCHHVRFGDRLHDADPYVVHHLIVNHRRVRLPGLHRIQHGSHFFINHLDEPDRFARRGRVLRCHGRYRFTRKSYFSQCDKRHVADRFSGEHAGQIFSCDDRPHSRYRLGGRRVDGHDSRMRMGAAQNRPMEHLRQLHVGTIDGGSADLFEGIHPGNRTSNDCFHSLSFSHASSVINAPLL